MVANPYFAIAYSDTGPSVSDVLLDGGTSEIDALLGALSFAVEASGEAVLAASVTNIEAQVGNLAFSTNTLDAHVLSGSPSHVDAAVGGLSFSVEEPVEVVLAGSVSQITAEVGNLDLAISAASEHVLSGSASQVGAETVKHSLSIEASEEIILAGAPSSVQAETVKQSLTAGSADEQILVASASQVDSVVGTLSLSTALAAERILSAGISHVDAEVGSLGLTVSAAGEAILSGSPSYIDADTGNLGLTASELAEHVLSASPAYIDAALGSLSLNAEVAPDVTLTGTQSWIQAEAGSLSLVTATAGEHLLNATPTEINAGLGNLQFSTDAATGEAICFQGAGYLYADQLSGYQANENGGYLAVWYKYDGGNPDYEGGFTYLDMVFSAHYNGDESRLEFQVGVLSAGNRPDLRFEVNDDRGTFNFETDLESDGGPNINDGNWHLLVWGNDTGGQGWYFYVDGIRYFGRFGGNRGDWFKQVQDNSANPFNEVDHAANRLQAPGSNLNLRGCLDEMIVVKERTFTTVDQIDMSYLWNGGQGVLIPAIESGYPSLWASMYNGWQYKEGGGSSFGDETKNPEGDLPGQNRFDLQGTGYTIITGGIPG